jgi:hypothetical protein
MFQFSPGVERKQDTSPNEKSIKQVEQRYVLVQLRAECINISLREMHRFAQLSQVDPSVVTLFQTVFTENRFLLTQWSKLRLQLYKLIVRNVVRRVPYENTSEYNTFVTLFFTRCNELYSQKITQHSLAGLAMFDDFAGFVLLKD